MPSMGGQLWSCVEFWREEVDGGRFVVIGRWLPRGRVRDLMRVGKEGLGRSS